MSENRQEPASKTGQEAVESCNEKFTPICRICGRKHWPLSPLCIGKKGAKAEAKAKAKADKLAKAEAKARAKAEKKTRAEVKCDAKAPNGACFEEVAEVKKQLETESAVREDLEAKLRAQAEEIAREKEEARKILDEERQARAKIESELAAERECRGRAEEKALEYARQREEIKQRAILAEQAKLTAEERLRVETQDRGRIKAEAEAMARVDPKAGESAQGAVEEDGACAGMSEEPCRNFVAALLELRARDIMQRDVTWCSPEESIEAVLARMRHVGCDDVIVGKDGAAEGIVARSELKGRLSSHVRRAMGKWKNGGSDATLRIPVKFVMIRGAQTIGEETSVTTVMKNMRQSGLRALAVVDEHGRVTGLVTACNVLKVRALLRLESNPGILAEKEDAQPGVMPGGGKTEVIILDAFRPSDVLEGAGKHLKSQISTS